MGKRILLLVGATRVYGAEIGMLNVMRGLKKRGYHIHCVVSGWNDGDFISRLQEENIPYSVLYLGFIYVSRIFWSLDTLSHYPRAAIAFYKLKKRFGPDYIYHLSFRTVLMLFPFLKRENNIHHVEDIIAKSASNFLFYSIIRRKVSQFIAVSAAVEKTLIALNIPSSRITVIPNGIPDFKEIQSKYRNENKDKFTIGIVGQIVPRKGHILLVHALDIVERSGKGFRCMIIGRGDTNYIQEVKEWVERYALESRIQWTDYIRDRYLIYKELDILVVPSYEEAFGLVALEASLFGMPVIASNVGGLAEIVQDGVTGFLFQPGDYEQLADKIILLNDNKDLRMNMGMAAREYALKSFTDEVMCNKIEKVLNSIQ